MIQEKLGGAGTAGTRRLRSASHSLSPPPGSEGNSQSDYEGGVWAALHKLNEMLLETVEKYDLEEIRCNSFDRTQSVLIEEIREDLDTYIVLVTSATADKNEASGKITEHEEAAE